MYVKQVCNNNMGYALCLHSQFATKDAAAQAWRFFAERIAIEEQQLQRFFGISYQQYAARTPTLIPFIK